MGIIGLVGIMPPAAPVGMKPGSAGICSWLAPPAPVALTPAATTGRDQQLVQKDLSGDSGRARGAGRARA
jgi:hypothetical protein